MVRRSWHFIPMIFALCFTVLSALAETIVPADCVEGESADPACEEPRIELSRIKVTATRRESPIERVPLSVTVLSGDKLREMGAASFVDYARSVPGLSFTDTGFGGEKYVIRGVTTDVFAEVHAATAVYLDETPITNASFSGQAYSPDPLLIDIDRIEVLRGPQGTLFGSGSMGGAIRIITNEPDPYAFESFAEAILSSTKHGGPGYEFRAMLNAPLADNQAAIRAVAYYRDLDGWIDNTLLGHKDVNNNETTGLRLAGSWSNQGRLTVNGKIVYQNRQSDGSGVDEGNPPWTQQRAVEEPNQDEWALINFNIDYEFDWGRLISTTSWIDRVLDTDSDLTEYYNSYVYPAFPFYPYIYPRLHTTVTAVNRDDQEEFVQEFRLYSTGDQSLNWLLGLFYQDQDFGFGHEILAPGFDEQTGGIAEYFGAADKLLVGRTKRSLEQTALFGDLIWAFSEKWEGTVGGRWFHFDHASVSTVYGLMNGGPTFDETTADETGFTPKFGLSYLHNRDMTLYGSIAAGYRPGGTNETVAEGFPGCPEDLEELGLTGIPQSYESDSLWSYELGFKSGWADRRVFLNTAVYYIDWTDIQTRAVTRHCGGWLENAGAATSKGIEIELAAYPAPNLELTLNGAYTNAKLSEDAPNLGGQAGNELPGVPEFAFGGAVMWFFRSFEGVTSSLRADYQYVGDSFNAFGFYRRETPSHSLTNLHLSFSRNRWDTSLFINNLFDNRAIVTVHDNFGGQYVTTARPFTVGVSVRFTH